MVAWTDFATRDGGGPDAPLAATAAALDRARTARALILVEGISDQAAVESLAARQGRDLAAEGVVVLPLGGSGEAARHLRRFGPEGARLRLAGLCDADAVGIFRRALGAAGLGEPATPAALAAMGFHVCDRTLEDELIRAVGVAGTEAAIAAEGELAAFRTLQRQPGWCGRPMPEQLHRFLRSKSRRSLRYARLLVATCPPERVPPPLAAVLASAASPDR